MFRLGTKVGRIREHVAINPCVGVVLTDLNIELIDCVLQSMSVADEPVAASGFGFLRSKPKHNECRGCSDGEF